jgi:hypothetical protein
LAEGAILTPLLLQLLKSTPASPTIIKLGSFVLTTAVNVSLLPSNTVTVFSAEPVGELAPPTAYFTNNSDVSVTPLPANHTCGVIPSNTSPTVIFTLSEPLNPPASVTLTPNVIGLLLPNAS